MEKQENQKTNEKQIEQENKKLAPKITIAQEKAQLIIPGGKIVELPILVPELGNPQIDMRSLFQLTGYFTFDPGFAQTSSCASSITYIDGEEGTQYHRGYSIEDLVENCTYLEFCYLLLYGELPSKNELKKFEEAVISEMMVHEKLISFFSGFYNDAHPMSIMAGVVGALSSFVHGDFDYRDKKNRDIVSIKLIAKMPTLAALAFRTAMGLPIVFPKKKYGYIENFLYMMFSNPMEEDFQIDPFLVKQYEKIFILHGDNEQGPSTSTVRIAGSSYANPFACISAGITSLWGPAHGGASEAIIEMLQKIGEIENVPKYIDRAKDRNDNFRLLGFGHRIFKAWDPRAKILKSMCVEILNKYHDKRAEKLYILSDAIEQFVAKDKYFIDRKIYPNLDLYSGICEMALGIPVNMFTVIFAVARSIGWIANWSEFMSDENQKIGRPRQLYVGPKYQEYIKIDVRQEASRIQNFEKLVNITNLMKI